MSEVAEKQFDTLIGADPVNRILKIGGYIMSENLETLLEKFGISVLGLNARKDRLWSKWQVEAKAEEIRVWYLDSLKPVEAHAAGAPGLGLDDIELAMRSVMLDFNEKLEKFAERAARPPVVIDPGSKELPAQFAALEKSMKSYIDRALSDIDDKLAKIHHCAQTVLRQQGEVRQAQQDLLRVSNNIVGGVNAELKGAATAIRRDVGAAVQKDLGALRESISTELRAIHLAVQNARQASLPYGRNGG